MAVVVTCTGLAEEELILVKLAMRNMSNSLRSSSYGLSRMAILCSGIIESTKTTEKRKLGKFFGDLYEFIFELFVCSFPIDLPLSTCPVFSLSTQWL